MKSKYNMPTELQITLYDKVVQSLVISAPLLTLFSVVCFTDGYVTTRFLFCTIRQLTLHSA